MSDPHVKKLYRAAALLLVIAILSIVVINLHFRRGLIETAMADVEQRVEDMGAFVGVYFEGLAEELHLIDQLIGATRHEDLEKTLASIRFDDPMLIALTLVEENGHLHGDRLSVTDPGLYDDVSPGEILLGQVNGEGDPPTLHLVRGMKAAGLDGVIVLEIDLRAFAHRFGRLFKAGVANLSILDGRGVLLYHADPEKIGTVCERYQSIEGKDSGGYQHILIEGGIYNLFGPIEGTPLYLLSDIAEEELLKSVEINVIETSFFAVLLLALVYFLVLKLFTQVASRDNKTDLLRHDQLVNKLAKNRSKQGHRTLLYLNIRDFSHINLRYGNAFGDKLLKALAHYYQEILGPWGELYYLSADEFFFLFRSAPFPSTFERVKTLVEAITEVSLRIGEEFVHFHVFCGLIKLQGQDVVNRDALYLIRDNFDEIMNLSGENFFVYQDLDHLNNIRVRKFKNKALVEDAIAEDRIVPFFQPIVNLKDGRVEKYEVLMRIKEEDKFLSPYRYIRIAEEFNLIEAVDYAVFQKSIDLLAAEENEVALSFNLSGKLLTNDRYLSKLLADLEKKKIPPWRITFEITETEHVGDLNNLEEILNKYKALGFSFAIDDFGTGFSSINYLKQLPVDVIKIDGAFIRDIEHNESNAYLVRSLVNMARAFGIQTVAEFVESEEIVKKLQELEVDFAQGYHFGKPTQGWKS